MGFGIITANGLIGTVELYDWHSVDTATLGIMLGKEHWGMGYGREAIQLLLTWGFKEGIETVNLVTLNSNLRAQKTFKALGFREVGTTTKGNSEFVNMKTSKEEFRKKINS